MKRLAAIAAAMSMALGVTARAEPCFLVKISDMMKKVEYKVVSPVELKALEKELQNEAKNFSAAVMAAGKEWRNDEVYKALPFPGGRLTARKFVGQPERFAKEDEADKKLGFYKDADAKRANREAEKLQEMQKKDKKAYDAKMAKAKEQEEIDIQLEKAMSMVQAKLDELMGKPPEQPVVPKEKPAADKAKDKEAAGKALDKAL